MSEPVPEREDLPVRVTPHDWPRPWMGPFLEALARVPNISLACQLVGIHRSTAYERVNEDPVFREAWKEAVEIGFDLMERIAHQDATTGRESEEVRRRVKRVLGENGELVTVEEETVTTTRHEVSHQLMMFLLRGYRHRRFREHVEHHLGPADELESAQPVGPVDDGVHRRPTHERMLALVELAKELEPGVAPVVDQNGNPVE
jgi:hypothetical protein